MRVFQLSLSVFFVLCMGMAHADEFTAELVKLADGKLTYKRVVAKKKKELTLPVDEKCRVVLAKFDAKAKKIEAGEELAGGLKNPIFDKLDKEAVQAWIRTSADNDRVLEMRLFQSTVKKKTKP